MNNDIVKKYGFDERCCFFCGETKNGPVFYNARYCTYFYPQNNVYKFYDGLFNHPIIINRYNVINISEGDEGIGVINSFGTHILENEYDEINVELKITATKNNAVEEKTIPFLEKTFKKGEVTDPKSWV